MSRRQVGPRTREVDRGSSQKAVRHHVDRGACSFLVRSVALPPSAERAVEPVAGEVVLRVHPTQEVERRRQDVIGHLRRPLGCEVLPRRARVLLLRTPTPCASPSPSARAPTPSRA